MRRARLRLAAIVAIAYASAGTSAPTRVAAAPRPIDVAHSTLTVFVYKSGLFSAFADDHVISAPIAGGSLSEEPPLAVDIEVRAADLKVLDPGMAADKRAEVQTRMLGPEVLDAPKFPRIAFASTAVHANGPDRWEVTGRLTIRDRTREITFSVARAAGRYRGELTIRQRDFGIEPIKVAGGTVKVKDELKLRFEIA